MKYMYICDNQSLMTAGVFYYHKILQIDSDITSNTDFIRFNADGSCDEELLNSIYDEEIVILGFIPKENVISSLLSKSNKISHYMVLEKPIPPYSPSIMSNLSYKCNVYYSTLKNRCNCLHLWKMLFPKENHPNIINVVNNNYILNSSDEELSQDDKAVYAYIGSLDSSTPLQFASLISEDVTNRIDYDHIKNIGTFILSYMNQIEARGVVL